jgi:hypothetical protein
MKIFLLSFGNDIYYNHLKRIKTEAESFNVFDEILIYNDKDLEKFEEFWVSHKDFILNNPRGYGYWIWKSFLTMNAINNIMNVDDILVYVDAGCSLNKNGIDRLYEYINIVKTNNCGNLSFELEHNEKTWTKMDLFEHLNLLDDNILNTKQLVGGIFILRKCDHVIELTNQWYKTMFNYHLINDSESILKNDISFIENRHDQSVFSLLRKKLGTITIKDETNCGRWSKEEYSKFPIIAHLYK